VQRLTTAVSAAAVAVLGIGMPMKMTAKLAPIGGATVAGTATVEPGKGTNTTHVTISLTGGTPGATYPWHVHTGKCPGGTGVAGPATAYKPITVDQSGKGSADITVPVALDDNGAYSVNVHKSPTEMGTYVSCGDLTMAGM
jgi:hypothetical protein